MNPQSPKTFEEWERCLVRHFLVVGSDGDASDIRSFEVTPTTLALACGAGIDQERNIEESFRIFMAGISNLPNRLNIGMQGASTRELPNFFIYLVMTLLIDSQLEGSGDGNEFRGKLRKWLNSEHGFQQLPGVNIMWGALGRWLDKRVDEGLPYRRLILPIIPKTWCHIGYTLRLTFPNKVDLRLMEVFLANCPQAESDPGLVVRSFPAILLNDRASDALKSAFSEFRESYLLGRRALADLRFWRLLRRAHAHSEKLERHSVVVDMMFDADGTREYFSSADQTSQAVFHPTLFLALNGVSAESSLNLSAAVKTGLLFFRQIGVGRWRAEARLCSAPQGLHMALARRHVSHLGSRLGRLVCEGDWFLTTTVHSYHSLHETLTPMGFFPRASEQIVRPRLSGGVRVAHGWLGRPGFLPHIESDTTDYIINPVDVRLEKESIVMEGGQLTALVPVEGSFVIEPERELVEKAAPWRLRVQLIRNALPHLGLGSSARYKLEQLNDWSRVSPSSVVFEGQDPLVWEEIVSESEDLLEAIYADGASGWEEAALVTLLRGVDTSTWDLLRCLQDAGIIEPRLRNGWKGRAWTLVAPRLVGVTRGNQNIAVIEGAVCASLIDEFRSVVARLGGQCFRRTGVSPWSPPVIGASVASVEALAEKMDWPLALQPMMPDAEPLAFVETHRMSDLHEVASAWDWNERRFKESASREEPFKLTRFSHPGGRDHDLYCLTSRSRLMNYLSRTAAIAAAHASSHTPLFEQRDDNLLVRLTCDGGLPDAVAAGLRRRLLRTAGPVGNEYFYPITQQALSWLSSLLPGCLAGPDLIDERPLPVLWLRHVGQGGSNDCTGARGA
ncbi:hypothetical protein ACNUIZ_16670 [Pseudomonas aeruginosa]